MEKQPDKYVAYIFRQFTEMEKQLDKHGILEAQTNSVQNMISSLVNYQKVKIYTQDKYKRQLNSI